MITAAASATQSTAHHRSVVRLLSSPISASVWARWLCGRTLGCNDGVAGATAAAGVALAVGAADTVWVTVTVTVGCGAGVFLGFGSGLGLGLGVGGGVGTPVARTLRCSVPSEVPTAPPSAWVEARTSEPRWPPESALNPPLLFCS